MRKVTYGAAVSLDGCIAGLEDSTDWLLWTDGVGRCSCYPAMN